jgi:uncharacterized glyoxalase superfamily protein PhnB
MAVSPIPKGYHTVTPQLAIEGAATAIAFYAEAFGAEVVDRVLDPSGQKVWHASLRLGDSILFVTVRSERARRRRFRRPTCSGEIAWLTSSTRSAKNGRSPPG